jgi:hypothetical protein
VWTQIPAASKTALNDAYGAWYTVFALTLKPHSPVETREKNRVRLASECALRAFVNQFLRFPSVTDQARDAMSIPNRDLIRTPHIDVSEMVEFELRLRNIREVLVNFWIKGETHRAKPSGYDGAVLVRNVLEAPPAGPHDLTLHTMAAQNPRLLGLEFVLHADSTHLFVGAVQEVASTSLTILHRSVERDTKRGYSIKK